MFKLDLEMAKEPEIKLPISVGSSKKQESSRKTSTSASLTMPKPLCGSQQTMENSERDGNTRPPYLSLEKSVCRSRSNWIGHGTTDWFQTGKEVRQVCIVSLYLFNLYAEHIMQNARLDEAQAGIKIAGRNINKIRYAGVCVCVSPSVMTYSFQPHGL